MDTHNSNSGIKLGLLAFAIISALAAYSWVQAIKISTLSHAITEQQSTIQSLRELETRSDCTNVTEPSYLSFQTSQPTPMEADDDSTQPPETHHKETLQPVAIKGSQLENRGDVNDHISNQEIRDYFSTLLTDEETNALSDEELRSKGAYLLEDRIQDNDLDFDSSLMAAYALNELTNNPIPEHLSQTLLQKATLSESDDDLHEALTLITEQKYQNSSLLALDLINSPNTDARMVGIYLLATDQEGTNAAPELANQIYTYPEETLQILGQLIGE